MSLMVPSAGGKELLKRLLVGNGGAISNATNASPTVITTSANHGLVNGVGVYIGGATGGSNINGGPFVVNNSTTTTFQIATISGTTLTLINGNTAFAGTVYWSSAMMEVAALKLTTTNHTPAESDTAGTWTEVANGSGYTTGGQTIYSTFTYSTQNIWNQIATVGSGGTGGWAGTGGGSFSASTNVPEATATTLVWNWTGTVANVYGYYVVGLTSGIIWWEEQWTGGARNFSNLDTFNLTPRFGLTHS